MVPTRIELVERGDRLSSMPAVDGGRVRAPGAPVRVLVVDDSAIVRGLIGRRLDAEPGVTVVGSAPNGEMALQALARTPADVVVLDIEMPVMDGLTALPHILALTPAPRVLIASSLTRKHAEITLRALRLGAADCIAKPEASLGAAEEFHRDLLMKVKALAPAVAASPAAPVNPAPTAPAPITAFPATAARTARSRPQVIAIGSSTGGPPALLKLFESLRGAVEQPIFLTQHMPATFTALLAEQLSRAGARVCAEAVDGEPVVPGRCYVAPGGWHMTVRRASEGVVIALNQDPPENFCRPAVDPMLRSLAQVYGPGVLAIILTGMGADGARGCLSVAERGGRFVAQDEASSVVWGMPDAAAQTGRADKILPLDEIGPWLRLCAGAAA